MKILLPINVPEETELLGVALLEHAVRAETREDKECAKKLIIRMLKAIGRQEELTKGRSAR